VASIINLTNIIKSFKGKEITPFSTIYNDQSILELGYLPSILKDYINTFIYPEVINGFEIFDLNIQNDGFATYYIGNGICAIAKQILSIKATQLLSINCDVINWPINNGYLLIDLCKENDQFFIKTFFVDKLANLYPNDYHFDVNDPHLIVGVLKIKNYSGNFGLQNVTSDFIGKTIDIKTKSFYVYCSNCQKNSFDSSQFYDALKESEFINFTNLPNEDKVMIEVVNFENMPINYNPTNYDIADNKIISHLTGIDSILSKDKLEIEPHTLTNQDLLNNYIITNNNIDPLNIEKTRIHIYNGIILYYNIDFTITLPNKINLFVPPLIENDFLTLYYFKTI